MAFGGRGGGPSGGGRSGGRGFSGGRFHGRGHYHYYYFPGYFSITLILESLMIIGMLLSYIYNYEVSTVDPLKNIKTIFFTAQTLFVVISVLLLVASNFFRENTNNVLKCLKIALLFSVIMFITLFSINVGLNVTYNDKTKFEELYEIEKQEQESFIAENPKLKDYMTNLGSKSSFVAQNLKAHSFFKIKSIIGNFIYVLVIMLNVFLIIINVKRKKKEDKIAKENEVLFDEEQNVKI